MPESIKTFEFKEGLTHELEILPIKNLLGVSRDVIGQPHRAEFFHVLWITEGTAVHQVDFKPVELNANDMLFLNKDIVQQFDTASVYDGYVVIFTDNFYCRTEDDTTFLRSNMMFNDLFDLSRIQIPANDDSFIVLLNQIKAEQKKQGDQFQSKILHNYLKNFLLHGERIRNTQQKPLTSITADLKYFTLFKELLEQQFKKERQIEFYANKLFLSLRRLNQATDKVFGKTAKQVIDERVLLEAKRLLAHTNDSIKELAYDMGFGEPTNFIKYFRKHSGLTPVEFRDKFCSCK